MSSPDDAAPKPTGEDGQQPKPGPKQQPAPESDRDEELAKWKTQARKHQKDYEAAAKRLQELEDRDKTELQKAAEALAAAKEENTSLHQQVLRMQVASELDLPADLAELLPGDDKDHMLAVGKKLAALRANPKPSHRDAGLGGSAGDDKPLDANAVLRLLGRHA